MVATRHNFKGFPFGHVRLGWGNIRQGDETGERGLCNERFILHSVSLNNRNKMVNLSPRQQVLVQALPRAQLF